MYEFCARHGVPHVRSGKLVVAHDEREVRELEALQRRGTENGVTGLEIVDRAFIVAREPSVNARFALWSPDTGIVNAEEFVKALLRTASDAGVMFLPATRLVGADRHAEGMVLTTEREAILARIVVNAAGLYADDVSAMLGGETFTIYPCRGEYAEFTPAKRGARQRAGVSAAPRVGPRSGRPPRAHDRRPGLARSDDPVSGAEGRLRRRSGAARNRSRTRRGC